MPALNFKRQFVSLVETGLKTQTIRQSRVRPFKAGDRLYLYTGMRTKSCRKLGEKTVTMVRSIKITETAVKIDGQVLYEASVEMLARADGFNSAGELLDFFRSNYGLPFQGQLIQWGNA